LPAPLGAATQKRLPGLLEGEDGNDADDGEDADAVAGVGRGGIGIGDLPFECMDGCCRTSKKTAVSRQKRTVACCAVLRGADVLSQTL